MGWRQRLMGRGDAHREELLRGIEMFSGLGPRQLRRLARLCVARDYAAGEWLIHQGDNGLGMFILVRGTAEVLQGEGERQLRLATLSAGDCVGEMSLIDAGPRSASVRVREDLHCLLITRDSFNALAQRDAAILWGMVPLLVKRLRQNDEKLAALLEHSGSQEHRAGGESQSLDDELRELRARVERLKAELDEQRRCDTEKLDEG
jgi:CRP/FNR family transcriptional regulator, cyclic AMP receptor protein